MAAQAHHASVACLAWNEIFILLYGHFGKPQYRAKTANIPIFHKYNRNTKNLRNSLGHQLSPLRHLEHSEG